MTGTGDTPPRIAIPPVPPGTPRPLWSVMIPTYECGAHLPETLASVLAEDPGPELMQIEVVDDHSTRDDIEGIVAEAGRGRVAFFRQPANVGHTRNFDTCLLRARGRLVHLLHGDDLVRPGFYAAAGRAFAEHPELGAVLCRHTIVDEGGRLLTTSPLLRETDGVLADWHETLALGQRLQAPSIAVRRDVYERLGGFDHRIRYYGEDWEMWTRIAAAYPCWYLTAPLATYRMHLASLSGRSMRTGENIRDLRTAVRINAAALPPARAAEISRRAEENIALAAIRRSHRMLKRGELATPLAQAREAARTSRTPRVLARLALLAGDWLWTALHLPRPRRRARSAADGR